MGEESLEIDRFRLLVLKKHLIVETELNLFISKYIFRCCKDHEAKTIDLCNIFQEKILDNLSFNKKREIVFDSLLCNKTYRHTFDNVASIKLKVDEHIKLARNIDGKIRSLNNLRNTIAHQDFLSSQKEAIDSMKKEEKKFSKDTIKVMKKIIRKSKGFVDIKAETINIDNWFNKIMNFFGEIEFKENK